MFDPNAHMPRPNRALIYMGACMIAGIRLAREKQVNVRVTPASHAIDESVELAHEIFNRVFRKVPEKSSVEISTARAECRHIKANGTGKQ